MQPELLVVLPVFNEQASVRQTIEEWLPAIEKVCLGFTILAIDDGSTDKTPQILNQLQAEYGSKLDIVSRANRGHGQTCLQGYRLACSRRVPWVFQIDSDGQCDPKYFPSLWKAREKYDVIYGHRAIRQDGWRRVLASMVLKVTLLVFARVWCVDANVPYRLMRAERLLPILESIPESFFLANAALSIQLRRAGWRQHSIPITFRERFGGEPAVKIGTFGSRAFELIRNIKMLSTGNGD